MENAVQKLPANSFDAVAPAVTTNRSVPAPALRSASPPAGPEVWAVGGGKGGTGKTLVCANLAVHLAQCGERVVAVDADLGGANLHTALGLGAPELTLSDFFHRRVQSLEEAALPTGIPNLRLLSGARNSMDADSLSFFQKEKLLRHLRRLDADRVLVDLGAGTSLAVLDLFAAADVPVVVALPEPTSVENLYRFLKAAFFRRLARAARTHGLDEILAWVVRHRSLSGLARPADLVREVEGVDAVAGEWIRASLSTFRPRLIVNQARHGVDAQLGESMEVACRTFLGIQLEFMGVVPHDFCFGAALKAGYPYLQRHYNQPAGMRLMGITDRLYRSGREAVLA
jgi:flagellar biosynthesis protein FlhG